MHKKRIIPALAMSGILAFNTLTYAAASTTDDDIQESLINPNIVVIMADDLGYTDLGAYGSEIATPNIDQLASEGVVFSNYHATASCAPSRAMLLTGVDNHLAGVSGIPETIPPEQSEYDNYKGVLSDNVATVASILNEDGYHTYMTGKWHLGKTQDKLPFNRGFERTLSMADTGADNYEHKTYMPMYDDAHWTKDGEEIRLEEPFYSSELLVDEMIGFIDSNLNDERPFFAYVSFLAVHLPMQAPKEYTNMYLDTYTSGWEVLRDSRYNSAVDMGLVPEDSGYITHDFIDDWETLNEEEKKFEAKRMAVYSGMITAMDDNIGRLVDYLDETGELDNTIFIITSDNGPEYSVPPEKNLKSLEYTHDYDDLGEIGSFSHIGPNWANAAASPLSFFKFYSGEGGLRVPLIISGAGIEKQEGFQDAFIHVTDITPTILNFTSTEQPTNRFGGREIHPITGKDITPILDGSTDEIYNQNDYIGYEVAGNIALFHDDHKLVLNRQPLGDNEWYMYNIVEDPGETKDLKGDDSIRFQHMLNLYARYAKENGVVPVPEHYDQTYELVQQMIRKLHADNIVITILVIITLGAFALITRERKKSRHRHS